MYRSTQDCAIQLFGLERVEAEEKAWKALERLSLTDAAHRKLAGYSKGMRQRVRLAQAIAHEPDLLVQRHLFGRAADQIGAAAGIVDHEKRCRG